jgi:hypothetical protein
MNPDFWQTTDGKAMHVALAKLAGCNKVIGDSLLDADYWFLPGGTVVHRDELPPPADLIRQLEAGMSEEQQRAYAQKIAFVVVQGLEAKHVFEEEDFNALMLFRCITASDEIRARAILEVL